MKKRIISIFIYLFLLNGFLVAQKVAFHVGAIILPKPLIQGVTNASINPRVVRSNQKITIFAQTEIAPTVVNVFFSHQSGIWSLYPSIDPNQWTNTINGFNNQSIYTANFISYYSNNIVTNLNKASYRVDNTPPSIILSNPSNGGIVYGNNWVLDLFFNDLGGAGLNQASTISNTKIIYTSLGMGPFDDHTNQGVFHIINSNQIRFIPNRPMPIGKYTVICFPVDNVGNTNYSMVNTNNYIRFSHIAAIKICRVFHKFKKHTQLTPHVPLCVYLEGTSGVSNVYFEVVHCKNIKKVIMKEIEYGLYRGTYMIQNDDEIEDGIIRGYMKDEYFDLNMDCDIPIDIGERVLANRGKDIYIVSPDDVDTKLLIPDKSLKEDAKVEIKKIDLYGDRYAYDFNMTSYANNAPMQYFDKPLTIFIHYTVNNEQVEKLNIPETELSKKATLLFHDRVQWLKVGGVFDTEEKVIKGNVKHFSVFALGIDVGKDTLSVLPNPFTPNNDADNDVVFFICSFKPDEPQKAEINIYSMDGFLRRSFTEKEGTINVDTLTINWDGKDSHNKNCDAGLYIYQAKIGNRRFQGTFVLAR